MEIRAATAADLDRLIDLDATIESAAYLHVERQGEGLAAGWRLEERPLREKRIDANALDDDRMFAVKQVFGGVEDGIGRAVEYGGNLIGLAVARWTGSGRCWRSWTCGWITNTGGRGSGARYCTRSSRTRGSRTCGR